MRLCLTIILLACTTLSFANEHGTWKWQIGNQLPGHLLQVGHESNGSPLYLCQAGVIMGGVQPGKTWNNYGICNVPYGGKELLQRLFNVYVLNPGMNNTHHWVKVNRQEAIPRNAFEVGHEQNGTALYLCRAHLDSGIQPGKTWSGYYGCNVPYGGIEKVMRPYYIFVWGPATRRLEQTQTRKR